MKQLHSFNCEIKEDLIKISEESWRSMLKITLNKLVIKNNLFYLSERKKREKGGRNATIVMKTIALLVFVDDESPSPNHN